MEKGNSEKAPAESQQVRVTQTPTEEEIARRAYQRYQARGGAGGSAEEDWQAAEQELRDELNEKAWADTLPRFALRPAALDRGRYRRFEAFLAEAGLIEAAGPVERLAVEVGAP